MNTKDVFLMLFGNLLFMVVLSIFMENIHLEYTFTSIAKYVLIVLAYLYNWGMIIYTVAKETHISHY